MKIFVSEIDRQNARAVALRNIARYFGIEGWEYKLNDRLKEEIENLENNEANRLSRFLLDYFRAYDDWFDFYQKKKAIEVDTGLEYELNDAEKEELAVLIDRRENTLEELQREFDRLQLQKFNRDNIGNVSGNIV